MSQELRLRIMSGIVMAAVVLVATYYGGWIFRLMSALLALVIYYEWSTITKLPDTNSAGNSWGWFSVSVIAGNMIFGEEIMDLPLLMGFSVTAVLLRLIIGGNWWLVSGIFYSGLSGISLAAIRGDDKSGLIAMLFVFAIVWATDILAYFVGRAIGGPKLAPSISPGKTWSGAIGGTFFGVVAGVSVSLFFYGHVAFVMVAIAVLLSVFSQIGDLFESYIKRKFKVKDSSHLIPGHGGFMDRADGLVFACFAVFTIAVIHALVTGDLPGRDGSGYLLGF